MITQFSTGRLHKRRTILERLFSDVGPSTVSDDMRVRFFLSVYGYFGASSFHMIATAKSGKVVLVEIYHM